MASSCSSTVRGTRRPGALATQGARSGSAPSSSSTASGSASRSSSRSSMASSRYEPIASSCPSGDQSGFRSFALDPSLHWEGSFGDVSRLMSLPSAFMTWIPKPPVGARDANAILDPSGDHAGSNPSARRTRPPGPSTAMTGTPLTPVPRADREKAMRRRSGDQRGLE